MHDFHIPRATYRLQLNAEFPIKKAKYILSYLKKLGISDIYSSPLTKSLSSSKHGYDVTDNTSLNLKITNLNQLKNFSNLLHKNNMFLLMDFVPNHMSTSKENKWWKDFLVKLKKSPYKDFFDVNVKNNKQFTYRRFFDINELVCLKVDNTQVFEAVHKLVWQLLKEKIIDGLRIDHIDGLYNPSVYLKRLKTRTRKILNNEFYINVEKILAADERIPSQWKIDGTTGYDFLNAINSIFVYKQGYLQLVKHYHAFTGLNHTGLEIRYLSKKRVIRELFTLETEQLTQSILKIAKLINPLSISNKNGYRRVIEEISASLPVYRTYINSAHINNNDKIYLDRALALTKKKLKGKWALQLNLIKKILFMRINTKYRYRSHLLKWIMQWQEYTGPIMAKGFEDTACYIYNPLVSVNEVGSDPGMTKNYGNISFFHLFLKNRRNFSPNSLNATSTHDTKRSEDIRMRINILSEIPDEWINHLTMWDKLIAPLKIRILNSVVPDRNVEIFLFQNLLGAWPISNTRFKDYMVKSSREAKIYTSWKNPDAIYESSLLTFIDSLLKYKPFLRSFQKFQRKIAFYGALNSLSQLLIKVTAPGIPDFYQGTELWNLKLVDPDNRDPVNFDNASGKIASLTEISSGLIKNICKNWSDGRIKLFLAYQSLRFRNEKQTIFQYGIYIPIKIKGLFKNNILSFCRYYQNNWIIIIIPRFITQISQSLSLPFNTDRLNKTMLILPTKSPLRWKNILTNEIIYSEIKNKLNKLSLQKILCDFPVGLLFGSSTN